MSIQSSLFSQKPSHAAVVTVGTFDGVHTGHQKLLREVVNSARGRGLSPVAITFRRQPRAVLRPDRPTTYLCSLSRRIELISAVGIETVIPVEFDDSIRTLSARDFTAALRESLDMRALILGAGATIGRNREGDEPTLRALGQELGFEFRVVEPALFRERVVSSTAVRHAIYDGRVTDAAEMLGRPYRLCGSVHGGDRRGRSLGFPTANLDLDSNPFPPAVPCDGVYATVAITEDGTRHMSATSVGVRPTFGGGVRTVETYLIDFDGDLYDHRLAVEFRARLRDEKKFASPEELVAQMHRDVDAARSILDT